MIVKKSQNGHSDCLVNTKLVSHVYLQTYFANLFTVILYMRIEEGVFDQSPHCVYQHVRNVMYKEQ